MAKDAYIGVGGKARKVKNLYIGVGGKARKVKKAYIGVGGKARLCYSARTVADALGDTWQAETTIKNYRWIQAGGYWFHLGNDDIGVYFSDTPTQAGTRISSLSLSGDLNLYDVKYFNGYYLILYTNFNTLKLAYCKTVNGEYGGTTLPTDSGYTFDADNMILDASGRIVLSYKRRRGVCLAYGADPANLTITEYDSNLDSSIHISYGNGYYVVSEKSPIQNYAAQGCAAYATNITNGWDDFTELDDQAEINFVNGYFVTQKASQIANSPTALPSNLTRGTYGEEVHYLNGCYFYFQNISNGDGGYKFVVRYSETLTIDSGQWAEKDIFETSIRTEYVDSYFIYDGKICIHTDRDNIYSTTFE